MSRKPRFNPEITRVKLNPEQAVLNCPCYSTEKGTTEMINKYDGNLGDVEYCAPEKAIHAVELCVSKSVGVLTPATSPDGASAT